MAMLSRNVSRISRPKSKVMSESCPVALATAQAKAAREMVLAVMAKAKAKTVVKKVPATKANVPRVVGQTVIAAMATLPRNRKRKSSPKSKATAEFCVAALVTAQAKAVKEMVLFAMAKAKVKAVVEKVAAAKKGFQWYPDPAEEGKGEGGKKGKGMKEGEQLVVQSNNNPFCQIKMDGNQSKMITAIETSIIRRSSLCLHNTASVCVFLFVVCL